MKRRMLLSLLVWFLVLPQAPCQRCDKYLSWAPRVRSKVFIAFFNHAHCYSWTTRHPFTKIPTGKNHLQLPRGSPFAFWCGACFTRSSLKANLTFNLRPKTALAVKPLKGKGGHLQHDIDDRTTCILSYGVTAPLQEGGSITCHLTWGNVLEEESLSFSVRGTVLVDEGVTTTVKTKDQKGVDLTCPNPNLRDKHNIVRVWHYPEESTPRVVENSLSAQITYQPKSLQETVACIVYDMMSPDKVWRRTFHVEASRKEHVDEGEDDDATARSPKGVLNTKNILIIVGVIIGGICGTILLSCLSLGLCPCQKERRSPPEMTKQTLLPFHPDSSAKPCLHPPDVTSTCIEDGRNKL